MATPTKFQNPTVLGLGVPASTHTLAGFAICALHLATIATLHLRAVHKTNSFSPVAIVYAGFR